MARTVGDLRTLFRVFGKRLVLIVIPLQQVLALPGTLTMVCAGHRRNGQSR